MENHMLITEDKLKFAHDILMYGRTDIQIRKFDSEQFITQILGNDRDFRCRQGRDVIIIMTAMLYLRSQSIKELNKDKAPEPDMEVNRQAGNLLHYVERGGYSNVISIFILKQCVSKLKINLITTADIHVENAVYSARPLMNGNEDSPDIEERRVALMLNKKIRHSTTVFGEFWDQDTQKAIDYLKSVDYKTI
jgi:hypothetical protein